MFDIHEDLPPDDPVSASSSRDGDKSEGGSGRGQAPSKRRYLIKKGGKQTIGAFLSLSFPPLGSLAEKPGLRVQAGSTRQSKLRTTD